LIGLISVKPDPDPNDAERGAHFSLMQTLVIRGAEQAIGEAKGVARFSSIDDWTAISEQFEILLQSQLDSGARAIIVLDVYDHPGMAEAVMSYVSTSPVPIIYVSSGETCRPPFHVFGDNTAAGLMAGQHLLMNGYTDIVYISPIESSWVEERAFGAARAVSQAGGRATFREIPPKEARLAYNPLTRQRSYRSEQNYLKNKLIETALEETKGTPGIFAATDDTAMIVYQIMSAKGLKPGVDYGLIGYDD